MGFYVFNLIWCTITDYIKVVPKSFSRRRREKNVNETVFVQVKSCRGQKTMEASQAGLAEAG